MRWLSRQRCLLAWLTVWGYDHHTCDAAHIHRHANIHAHTQKIPSQKHNSYIFSFIKLKHTNNNPKTFLGIYFRVVVGMIDLLLKCEAKFINKTNLWKGLLTETSFSSFSREKCWDSLEKRNLYVPAAPDPGTSAFLSSSMYFPFSIAMSSASWEISNSETMGKIN